MPPLSGKVAFVTGASAPNGIGRAIAKRLAEDGAAIVVTDVDETIEVDGATVSRIRLLDAFVADLASNNVNARAFQLDVTKQEDVAAAVAAARRELGRIDVLVNNAGSLAGSDSFLQTTPDQWRLSFEVNVLGPMMLSQAVIPIMRSVGGGRIINIGSTGSLGAEPGFGAYTAMKHGLVGLTKTVAAEFGAVGILCNTVCPGYIATDMHMAANARLAEEQSVSIDEIKQRRYANVAVRNAGTPSDVANAVAYLAGPHARYVTGVNLPVAGGVPFGI